MMTAQQYCHLHQAEIDQAAWIKVRGGVIGCQALWIAKDQISHQAVWMKVVGDLLGCWALWMVEDPLYHRAAWVKVVGGVIHYLATS